MWALDPMLRGPDASARVILVLNQNHNASDMSWDAQAVKSISNLNLGPQITFRNAFNSLSLFKTEMIGIVWGWRLRNEAAFRVQVWVQRPGQALRPRFAGATCGWRITKSGQIPGVLEVLVGCLGARHRHRFRSFDRHSGPIGTTGRAPFGRCRIGARQTSTAHP